MKFESRFLLKAAAFAALAAGASQSKAAIIAQQGFESDSSDTLAFTYSGAGAPSQTNLATDYPANSRVRTGVASFQSTSGTSVLTFSSVNLAYADDTVVDLRLAAISATSANGVDANDSVSVFIALDGAAFSTTPDLKIVGAGNVDWSYAAGTDIASTQAGTPVTYTALSNGSRTYSHLTISLPDSAVSFKMKVESVSGTGEIWAMDDITVSAVPEPATFGMLLIGGTFAVARRRRSHG